MPNPHAYNYAIIRVVPRVERGEFINAGAILHCRTLKYLDVRVELDEARLACLAPDVSVSLVRSHLEAFHRICVGDVAGGPIAALPAQERFYWLVAARSTIIQTSPIHSGIGDGLQDVLERLMVTMVRR